MLRGTAALRAHQRDMADQLVAVAAEILAARAGLHPDDPEPQIAATALLGLWEVQFSRLRKYLDGSRTTAQVHEAVTADVERAARVIADGLNSLALDACTDGSGGSGSPGGSGDR